MPYCYITHDPNVGSYTLKCEKTTGRGFNTENIRRVNNFIRTVFPASHRNLDVNTWTWELLCSEEIMIGVKAVAKNEGFQIKETIIKSLGPNDFFYDATPSPVVETKETIAKKLETLLSINVSTVPFDELKKAYRRKALELHPDRNNGDGSKMSELNSIWSAYNGK